MKDIQSAANGAIAGSALSGSASVETTSSGPDRPPNLDLLSQGAEVIRPFFQTLETLRDTVLARARESDSAMSRKLVALAGKTDSFEASVTLVGPLKAGKTALVNVLSGQPGLMPEDGAALTPVVTELHVNARQASRRTRALFRFFDPGDRDRMMRDTARRHLSADVEPLSGKSHKFSYVDRELIGRYVCAADPDNQQLNPQSQQGKFADITRSAEIWLDVPQLSGSYLFRDTPGVNDRFLLREQVTLQALRGSKICVMVLSAHEALNATDLALIRLITNSESRQVVLFVNRIDELDTPSEQVAGIYESIHKTLRPYGRLRDVKVVFGSARWAAMALRGERPDRDEDGKTALSDWARNCDVGTDPRNMAHLWKLSGIPELMRSINERIVEGSGARHLAAMRGRLANIAAARAARKALVSGRDTAGRLTAVDPEQLRGDLDAVVSRAREKLEETLSRLEGELAPALTQVQQDYVLRATDALTDHLCKAGTKDSWTFNSSGLRLVLRTTCDRFSARARAQVETVFYGVASDLSALCSGALGLAVDGFRIEPPQVPKAPPPVVMGKTITIDLRRSWWKRWWLRRRNPATLAAAYRSLIEAGICSATDDLKQSQVIDVSREIRRIFDDFLAEQTATVLDLANRHPEGGDFGSLPANVSAAIRPEKAPGGDPEAVPDPGELRKAVGGY
ncbi:dynamin family protein [Paracoccus sp. IB05]|uniref:dynamin family protein n=1 Tax=Paracoccus sp. IB05 TaxID=2779367 RepID=UPI0018E7FAC6|nr:dynamin family protein [Paracoccus sp. IB05]MBJ2150122.1 dynamin family protein [Paracoccus sp. IB05]